MIADARKTRGIIRRDTRANQPAATDVLWGTLYYVTDEGIIERSNGVAWESYSSTGTPPTTPAGVDTQVQFNDGGVFGADVGFAYNKASNTLFAGNFSGQINGFTFNQSVSIWSVPQFSGELIINLQQANVVGLVTDLASKLTDNAWVDIPFNAANFTGTGTIVWTVSAVDQQDFSYKLIGNLCVLNLRIEATDISGVGNELRIALPAAITPLKDLAGIMLVSAGGAVVTGFFSMQAGVATFRVLQLDGSNWPVGTGNTSIYHTLSYQI